MFLFTFTMFFSGGMVPLYLTIQDLGLYNTLWALALPMAVSVYNLIVCRSFFESSLPIELLEAAKLDGCSDFGFFFKIAIPLSSTIIAVMVLISGILRLVQETRSGNAAASLSQMLRTTACVERAGQKAEIPLEEIVAGDLVYLSAGDMIPADLRILCAKDLFLSQSA